MDIDKRLQEAVQSFWTGRDAQADRQKEAGKVDAGIRGAVTGGQHMGALETLVVDIHSWLDLSNGSTLDN